MLVQTILLSHAPPYGDNADNGDRDGDGDNGSYDGGGIHGAARVTVVTIAVVVVIMKVLLLLLRAIVVMMMMMKVAYTFGNICHPVLLQMH